MHNRESLQDLIDYTDFTWAAYGRAVATLPPEAFAAAVPNSGWPSLGHALFHLAGAWDGWFHDRLGIDDRLDVDPATIASWDELQPHREKVRGWMRRVIDETSDADLLNRTGDTGKSSDVTRTSVGDVIAHVLLHERGHHGDISTILGQLGAQAPEVDYIVYLWFQEHVAGKR